MLELNNTMSRSREIFRPRSYAAGRDRLVKIFTCGPSIYRRPHIGNYRTFLFEDILVRYLEHLDYSVQRVINFTDVEDKTLREAAGRGVGVQELTADVAECFFEEADQLRLKLPAEIPRSSTTVAEAVRLIQVLLDKGVAYWHEGDIFFDPLKYPQFGKLFRLDMSRWPKKKRRFRLDTYPGQQWNLGDFILWHGYRDGDPVSWDTELGRGRPSWNVQDPAIISKHLGPAIDIHCGGIDNLWRHHDYNIAVMESVYERELARYWLHGEHLLVNGAKMSKSRGNILYPEDVLGRGFLPRHLRFFLIFTHYRRRLNYTEDRLRQAVQRLEALRRLVNGLVQPQRTLVASPQRHQPAEERGPSSAPPGQLRSDGSDGFDRPRGSGSGGRLETLVDSVEAEFRAGMDEDLAVGRAFERVEALLQRIETARQGAPLGPSLSGNLSARLRRIDQVWRVLDLD